MSETDGNATTDTASQEAGQDVATNDTQLTQEAEAAAAAEAEAGSDADAEGSESADGADKTKDPESDVPDTYEFQIPEGAVFDQTMADDFTPLAKDLGLTQENADKLVGFFAEKAIPHLQQQFTNQLVEAQAAQQAKWAEAAKGDEEFGGDKFDENAATAKAVLQKLGTPELTAFLNETGLGDHPEVIRFFYRVGKSISEDSLVGGEAVAGELSVANKMFPNMN